ncbi:MAG: hypothetical protein WCT50_04550 [Patescibacteria group bacterium]|jgi:hypothetical protein
MKKIINLTPHAITIVGVDGVTVVKTIPTEGSVRLKTATEPTGESVDGVPLTKTVFGEPEGLPEQSDDTIIIVSQLVKTALPQRSDLVVPAEVVRDPSGNIIGAKSLGI